MKKIFYFMIAVCMCMIIPISGISGLSASAQCNDTESDAIRQNDYVTIPDANVAELGNCDIITSGAQMYAYVCVSNNINAQKTYLRSDNILGKFISVGDTITSPTISDFYFSYDNIIRASGIDTGLYDVQSVENLECLNETGDGKYYMMADIFNPEKSNYEVCENGLRVNATLKTSVDPDDPYLSLKLAINQTLNASYEYVDGGSNSYAKYDPINIVYAQINNGERWDDDDFYWHGLYKKNVSYAHKFLDDDDVIEYIKSNSDCKKMNLIGWTTYAYSVGYKIMESDGKYIVESDITDETRAKIFANWGKYAYQIDWDNCEKYENYWFADYNEIYPVFDWMLFDDMGDYNNEKNIGIADNGIPAWGIAAIAVGAIAVGIGVIFIVRRVRHGK